MSFTVEWLGMKIWSLLLLWCCLLLSPAWAEQGEPPKWVENGRWKMRLESVEYVQNLESYKALPWGESFQGDLREKNLEHVEKAVFGRSKKVALVTLTCKNRSAEALKIGTTRPYWMVRLDDGQQVSNNHSFMRSTSENLKSGMPKLETAKPGQSFTWKLAFYIPDYCVVNTLFFRAPGHIEKSFGPTESLVLRTGAEKVKGGRQLSGASLSDAPWVEIPGWKMRVTGAEYIPTLERYKGLPWNQRMTGKTKEKHLRYMAQQVYGKKKRIVLLMVELKNTQEEKQKVGVKRPYWLLTGSDQKVVNNGNSFVRQVPFLLHGGLPQETLLNSGHTVRGWMAFVLPEGVKAETLSYKSPGLLQASFGKTGAVQLSIP